MSIEADNPEHEQSVEELLREVILRMDLMLRHFEEITDEKFTEEDIDE